MKTFAVVAGMLVVISVVVVGLRIAYFVFLYPEPQITIERLFTEPYEGPAVAVDVDVRDDLQAQLDVWLSPPDDFVVQGRIPVDPADRGYGGEFRLDVFCLNRRGADSLDETFHDGILDSRGWVTIGIVVRTQSAVLCSVGATAKRLTSPPREARRSVVRVSVYCLSECMVVEPEVRMP